MATKAINSSDIVLALIVEGIGLGVVTLIAGISEDVGTVMVVFMIGLFLLFLINHQGIQGYISNVMGNVQGALNG
jgi:hypothetical protein